LDAEGAAADLRRRVGRQCHRISRQHLRVRGHSQRALRAAGAMGASASVLAGAAVPAIKKAGSGVSHAVVAVTPRFSSRSPALIRKMLAVWLTMTHNPASGRARLHPIRKILADAQSPGCVCSLSPDAHCISPSPAPAATLASAETRKFVKMYAKEGYRQVSHYTKRGLRTAARGLTIATTIARKLDVAGSWPPCTGGSEVGWRGRGTARPESSRLPRTEF
jgi:hypothetical protein